MLLYAMVCGTVPFKAHNMPDLHKLIKAAHFTFPLELSPELKDLISGLLLKDPIKRYSIPEILNHKWLLEYDVDDDLLPDENIMLNKQECKQANADDLGNINVVNPENLFFEGKDNIKMSYTDYCYIANDFYTHHIGNQYIYIYIYIDEEAVRE